MTEQTSTNEIINPNEITLDEPIKRGETLITKVEVIKPNAGALRGVGLRDILDLDVNALIKVLPRVTTPTLTEAEVSTIDPADLTQLGSVVAGFLLSKSVKVKAGI